MERIIDENGEISSTPEKKQGQHVVRRSLRVRDFGKGGLEITCKRHDLTLPNDIERARMLGAHARPRAKRGESEDRDKSIESATKRARRMVRQRCKALAVDTMLTLNYRENMQDAKRLQADLQEFVRQLRKHYSAFEYVAVVERQERGAFHIHMGTTGKFNFKLLHKIWFAIVGDGMGNVDVSIRKRKGRSHRHKLAAYLSKYISKAFEDGELNAKRYWSSKGIQIPKQEWFDLCPWADDLMMMQEAFDILKDRGLSEPKYWWSQQLGIFWLTAS